MTPSELYRAGKLDEAVQAALAAVKAAPEDGDARWQLAELSAIAGDLERADKQLDVIGQQRTDMALPTSVFRQLIRAETARREVFTAGRVPEFIGLPSELLKSVLEALTLVRAGQPAQANQLLQQVEATRRRPAGQLDGRPFTDIRDLDDLLAPVLEVLTTTGRYFWTAWENIERIEFEPLKRSRDLLWRPARMSVRGGPDGVVYIPVVYQGTTPEHPGDLRLARGTDWVAPPDGPVRGLGQRTLLVGDIDTPLLECTRLEFDDPLEVLRPEAS
jgi:type VI secretion system protein ImpE